MKNIKHRKITPLEAYMHLKSIDKYDEIVCQGFTWDVIQYVISRLECEVNSEQFISIREFAEKAGCSTQAVYKRKNIAKYFRLDRNGHKLISTSALKFFYIGRRNYGSKT